MGDVMAETQKLPLDGITVLAFEHAVAAPFATRQLADLGADVIKVERREGDFARGYDTYVLDQSSYFVWLNRGKRSLVLDVKQPDARPVLDRLLARADILMQNLSPGASARLGLDYAALAPLHPRLIVCDISGYGEGGPYQDKKAYDLLIQAEAGLVSLTGTPETATRCGASIADVATGMYAFSGCLAALVRRGVTGRGGHVRVSMLEALAEWVSNALYRCDHGGGQQPRMPMAHPLIVPYGAYTAGDGTQVILAVQNDREWAVFCRDVLEQPALCDDPRYATNEARVAAREAIRAMVERRFAGLSGAEASALLDRANIACGRVNDIAAVLGHPQLAARERWQEIGTEHGRMRALKPPIGLDGPALRMGDVPALGAHSRDILAELGFPPDRIAALQDAGVV